MMYASNLLSDYNAVFEFEEKLQSSYKKYGICFETTVVVSPRGYIVEYKAKALQEQTN